MRTIDEYMKLPYKVEVIPDLDEGGYVASHPELVGCITCGDTMESAVANLEDAKRVWLVAAIEDGLEIPEPESANTYSGQFKLRIPKSLHKALAEHSKAEGISMNQYCLYLLTKNDALYPRA
jgi:predicted RNase H-like HicB family nuclease